MPVITYTYMAYIYIHCYMVLYVYIYGIAYTYMVSYIHRGTDFSEFRQCYRYIWYYIYKGEGALAFENF